jgi:hypothetical protein
LVANYDTLEGHQKLNKAQLLELLEYSSVLAKDQGGCRLLQKYIVEKKDQQIFDKIFNCTRS